MFCVNGIMEDIYIGIIGSIMIIVIVEMYYRLKYIPSMKKAALNNYADL